MESLITKVPIIINSEPVLEEKVAANPKGRFTLLKIGEYSYNMNGETINSKSWFIRNNETNKEYWTPAEYIHSYGNKFTNIYIENRKMYTTDVQVIDYLNQYKEKCFVIDEARKLMDFMLHHGRVVDITGKRLVDESSLSWKEEYKQLEERYETLQLYEDFDSFMKWFIPECNLPIGLYFASVADNEIKCLSYNKDEVINWMKGMNQYKPDYFTTNIN